MALTRTDRGVAANPYRLDSNLAAHWPTNFCVNFSGGRSSGYLLYHILSAYDFELPDNIKVVFCNTGKENPETLDFVRAFGDYYNLDIHWVEYNYDRNAYPRHQAVRTSFERASRKGEPFESLIKSQHNYLPSPVMRICTKQLKKKTAWRYLRRELGWRRFNAVIGFRHDESKRVLKTHFQECLKEEKGYAVFPMYDAGVCEDDVLNFWRKMPFDLKLQKDEGNCDLCFLKGKAKNIALIRKNPEKANWWVAMEKLKFKTASGEIKDARFHKRYTYQSLVDEACKETPPEPAIEDAVSCWCTD